MTSDPIDRDAEHRDLAIEGLELQIEKLQLRLQVQCELRDLGDLDGADEIVDRLMADYQAGVVDLQARADAHNAKVLEHIIGGSPRVDSDLPPGVKDFIADMFPGSIVIRVGGSAVMFGDYDAPEETERIDPTDVVDAPG